MTYLSDSLQDACEDKVSQEFAVVNLFRITGLK